MLGIASGDLAIALIVAIQILGGHLALLRHVRPGLTRALPSGDVLVQLLILISAPL